MSLLRPTAEASTKTLSVRVPAALYNDLETVRKEAAANGLSLDLAAIVTKAVASAVKTAQVELSANRVQRSQAK